MLRQDNTLLINRNISLTNFSKEDIIKDNKYFIDQLISNSISQGLEKISYLPDNSPFEIHPYKKYFPLRSYDKYIIGTFPPISYVYDLLPEELHIVKIRQPLIGSKRSISKPKYPFYHGNRNLMWDFLLTNLEISDIPSIRKDSRQYFIKKLDEMHINYADIIDSAQRSLEENNYKGSDYLLKNIDFNKDLILHILENINAKYLLFNTSGIYGLTGLSFDNNGYVDLSSDAKAFDIFIRSIQELGFKIELRVMIGPNDKIQFPWTDITKLALNSRRTKLAFEMRISNNQEKCICEKFDTGFKKEFTVITPFSPAVSQRINILRGNPIVNSWLMKNVGNNTKDLLFNIYQEFRNNNLISLFNLNQ